MKLNSFNLLRVIDKKEKLSKNGNPYYTLVLGDMAQCSSLQVFVDSSIYSKAVIGSDYAATFEVVNLPNYQRFSLDSLDAVKAK